VPHLLLLVLRLLRLRRRLLVLTTMVSIEGGNIPVRGPCKAQGAQGAASKQQEGIKQGVHMAALLLCCTGKDGVLTCKLSKGQQVAP
jgi:hypothetical protein